MIPLDDGFRGGGVAVSAVGIEVKANGLLDGLNGEDPEGLEIT